MKSTPIRPLVVLLAVATLAGTGAVSSEPEPRSKARSGAADEPKVYTNEDLERMFRGYEPPPTPADPAAEEAAEGSDPARDGAGKAGKPGGKAAGKAGKAARKGAGKPGHGPAAGKERGAGEEPGSQAGEPSSSAEDPLAWMEGRRTDEQDRLASIAEAEKQLATARSRVHELERRMRALKNPLLARPAPPEGREAEWNAMTSGDRVRATEEALRQAREELTAAEHRRASLGSS